MDEQPHCSMAVSGMEEIKLFVETLLVPAPRHVLNKSLIEAGKMAQWESKALAV